jgi:hypothetical protein
VVSTLLKVSLMYLNDISSMIRKAINDQTQLLSQRVTGGSFIRKYLQP